MIKIKFEALGGMRSVVLMGVSGCGKTSVGEGIYRVAGKESKVMFLDADDFHPQENKTKMANGKSLNDNDRLPWLLTLHNQLKEHSKNYCVVLACSALKQSYRKLLMCGIGDAPVIRPLFVFLCGSFETIKNRLIKRAGHFMNPSLLQSQFDTLEIPSADEDFLVIDIDTHSIENIITLIIQEARQNETKTCKNRILLVTLCSLDLF